MLAGQPFFTHAPQSFYDLEKFLRRTEDLYEKGYAGIEKEMPASIRAFLQAENFTDKLAEIKNNVSSPAAFRKRFFAWFDAFRAMKYVHFVRDEFYPDLPVSEAASLWLGEEKSERELLEIFREADKNGK